jgi:hypothetical protein
MNRIQRAQQLWPILVMAAGSRQILTYKLVSKMTGLAQQGIGAALFPIQYYCEASGLPKLTALVVQEKTGLPGPGLSLSAAEFAAALQEVFSHQWLVTPPPTEDELLEQESGA